MNEIVISIEIENNNDIKISNEENGYSFNISYENKFISASSIYRLLSYKSGSNYFFKELGIERKTDNKVVEYYGEVVKMLKKICDEVTKLEIKNPDQDIEEIDILDEESE